MKVVSNISVLALIFLFSIFATAQPKDSTVTFVGKVVDQNHAAIVGARVAAIRAGTSVKNETVTNNDGEFTLSVAVGDYKVTVAADGFEVQTRDVSINSSEQRTGPIVLQILPATAMVTIGTEGEYIIADTRTATKTYTPLRDVPQSITVIKQEQIAEQQMTSVADLVRYVPGISSHQGENNRDDVVIRGNRSSADFYRDGVRDDVQYYRDMYNLQQVEALKGPNAMIFGRGGGGGVINRVTKEAGLTPVRAFSVTGGSYRNRRFTGDLGQPLGSKFAFRVNGVYENSDSFRRFVGLERGGINPTFTFTPDSNTSISIGYEFFRDRRTADRGIVSFGGRPAEVPISTFYGDPDQSKVRSDVHLMTGTFERLFGELVVRNHFMLGKYDRGYQNFVPGAANSAGTLVPLTAYNNSTKRTNFFDQTDLMYLKSMWRIKHTLLGGAEFGRQSTNNFRNTGYFNNIATSIQVPFSDPVTKTPVTFRQSATDADNHLTLNLAAAYLQDQIEFSKYVQAIIGVRYDHFDLTYLNNRNGQVLSRIDRLVSPRVGLVIKPATALSLYTSYSVSQLPSSGDQFSSLTVVTQQVKPEKFTNVEAGVKWDVSSRLSFTTAVYRLDRTNTRATDPNDPTRILQTGSQRTTGFESGLSGSITNRWSISGGYAWQDARITSATTAAPAGRQVALVPRQSLSLWNKYQITRRLGAGLGLISRSDIFAAVDNAVVLPAYFKADAAVYYNIAEHWRLQANVENLTNKLYYVNADGNNNISPGAPRSLKVGLTARF